LRYAEKLTVFVCTAGVGTTDQYKQYMEQNELLKAYFVDMMGTIAVEKAMDIIQQKLAADLLSDSLKITNRYSPGYCGWLVKEQSKLFSLLPENPCGVTLTSSSLMIPSKSISGVIGIGKEVRFSQYECQLCEMKTCLYRKKHIKSSK
jgi:cobalamin-dependent methionine synthase I